MMMAGTMRRARRIAAGIGLAAAASLLTGCYDDYGYGGVAVGYGAGGYYDAGPGYGYGYGDPYGYAGYGWYDGFYYPGTGFYVYDRGGGRRRWDDRQRAYWQGRPGYGRPGGGYAGRGGIDGRGPRDANRGYDRRFDRGNRAGEVAVDRGALRDQQRGFRGDPGAAGMPQGQAMRGQAPDGNPGLRGQGFQRPEGAARGGMQNPGRGGGGGARRGRQ